MNNEQLIRRVSRQAGLSHDDATQVVDGFFTLIKFGLAQKENVKINKFGTFSPKVIKTKLSKNKNTNKIEIQPNEIVPNFAGSKSKTNKAKPKAKQKPAFIKPGSEKPAPVHESRFPAHEHRFIEEREEETINSRETGSFYPYYKKIIYSIIIFFVIFSFGVIAGLYYYKHKYLNREIRRTVENYLNEKGMTHAAIQELVDSRSQNIMDQTEEYNRELTATLSTQLTKIRKQQEVSYNKLAKMEEQLKGKIAKLIRPQLIQRKKKAEIKIMFYKVKKNDTLWSISETYLKNPYNWVGLYQTNGQKIKNPNLIYPGQQIFIPMIHEF